MESDGCAVVVVVRCADLDRVVTSSSKWLSTTVVVEFKGFRDFKEFPRVFFCWQTTTDDLLQIGGKKISFGLFQIFLRDMVLSRGS